MSATLTPTSSAVADPAPPERPFPSEPPEDAPELGRRLVPVAAAVSLILPISETWDYVLASPRSGLTAIGLIAADLLLLCLLITAPSLARIRRLERWLLALAALTLVVLSAGYLAGLTGYGSDEAALTQGAARTLLAGHDPYGANLTASLWSYLGQSLHATQLIDGSIVHTYSYPALPLLLVAPVTALTGGGQAVPITDALVLVLAMVVMFRRLPDGFGCLAIIVCAGLGILWQGSMDGMTQVLAMAPLVYVAAGWSRVGREGQLSRRDWACAVALGLAVCANQVAWFIAPFILAGIALINVGRHGVRPSRAILLRFGAGVAATFLLVNAPFIAWSPGAWLGGVAAPLVQHAIPLGQGLVGLTLFAGIGGGNLSAYSDAALACLGAGLIVYALWFRTLGRACFVLPLVALFLSPRSLGSYWMLFVAVIVTSGAADDRAAISGAHQLLDQIDRLRVGPNAACLRVMSLRARVLALAIFAPTLACLVVALASTAPLQVAVATERSARSGGLITALTLRVTNHGAHALAPHFSVSNTSAAGMTPFWRRQSGPRSVRSGQTATYTIVAGDSSYAVAAGSRFVVYALASDPDSVSSSAATTAARTSEPVASLG